MNLFSYFGRSILYPIITFIQKLGLPSHDMSSNVSTPTNVIHLPCIKAFQTHRDSFYYFLDRALGTHCSPRELTTIWASLSMIISFRPRSHASSMPSSTTLASVSSTPKGSSTFLLMAHISWPLSFLIITPTPQHLISSNIAPFVLTFYHPCFGGVQGGSIDAGGVSWGWFVV